MADQYLVLYIKALSRYYVIYIKKTIMFNYWKSKEFQLPKFDCGVFNAANPLSYLIDYQ